MQKITTFLTYKKGAEDAVKLYTSVFKNSRIVSTTRYSEGSPEPAGGVMTVEFELEGQRYLVLKRMIGGAADVITIHAEPHGDTLDELLAYARAKYASGEGVR